MRKVVVSSVSGYYNIGDEAMLDANLLTLRDRGIKEITVLSDNPETTSRLHRGIKAIPSLYYLFRERYLKSKNSLLNRAVKKYLLKTYLKFMINSISTKSFNRLSEKEKLFLKSMIEADAFLLCGGGFLNDIWTFGGIHAKGSEILLAKSLGKEVFIGAQSIGPLYKKSSVYFLRNVLENTTITLRDKDFSRETITNMLKLENNRIFEVADDAFSLPFIDKDEALKIFKKENVDINIIKRKTKVVGINARGWWKRKGQSNTLRSYVIEILSYLVGKGYHVIFIPMAYTETDAFKDVRTSLEVVKDANLSNNPNINILRGQYDWFQIKGLIGYMDFAVGISYHFNVFATSLGVPTIGIYQDDYYKLKLKGFYRLLGKEELAVDVRSTPLDAVKDLLERVMMEKEFLHKRSKDLARTSCYASKQLAEYLQKGGLNEN